MRRQPRQAFTIDFGPEVVRLYDEWDALARKAADPAKRDVAGARLRAGLGHRRRRHAADPAGRWCRSALLSSVADVTAGSAKLISRTVA